jgi:hypothetical protein
MISPVWVVINSIPTIRRTNAAVQDNLQKVIVIAGKTLAQASGVLNQLSLVCKRAHAFICVVSVHLNYACDRMADMNRCQESMTLHFRSENCIRPMDSSPILATSSFPLKREWSQGEIH